MVGYAVYLQRFHAGEPCGISHHVVEAVLGVHGPVSREGDRWSLLRPDWAEAIGFTSHPVDGVSAITISRPTNASGLRGFIFEMLQLDFVFFTQDLDCIFATEDRRAHLPDELRDVSLVLVTSPEEIWPDAA